MNDQEDTNLGMLEVLIISKDEMEYFVVLDSERQWEAIDGIELPPACSYTLHNELCHISDH